MKIIIHRITVLVLLVSGFGCSSNNIEISGLIEGGHDQTITLERLEGNRTLVIDSIKTGKDGSFSIKTQLEEPDLYILKNQAGELINLLLSPGEKVVISTHPESFEQGYQVSGSEETENIRLLVEHMNKTRSDIDSLLILADSIESPDNPQLDIINSAYVQTIIKQKRYTIRYLVENMTSLSSVYALYQKYNEESLVLGNESDFQYFKTVADSLDMAHPNSSLSKSLRADVERKEAQFKQDTYINSLLSRANEITGLMDITIPDRDGKEITLSDLKGKVVLVTFWASGNASSVQALLRLQSAYKKYHSKGFEIYAISLDNNKIRWMNAIDFNEFNWINVSELSYPNSKTDILYNVTELPSSFIINREGDIVAKNIFGRNLETWLDNLI